MFNKVLWIAIFLGMFTSASGAKTLIPIKTNNIIVFVPVNLAPKANDDAFIVNEDETGSLDVMANDSDDGNLNNATLELVSSPVNGVAQISDGTILYTPASHFHGTDSFIYRFIDEGGKPSQNATVSLTVNPVNDAPVAVADTYSLTEDHSLTQLAVLNNDSDVDSSTFTAELVQTNPLATFQGRTLTLRPDGNGFDYQAPANTHGEDWFTYRLTDDLGAVSAAVRVSVNITPQNDAPVAYDLDVITDEDTSVVITPSAWDIDGDNISYLLWDTTQNGTADTSLSTANGSVSIVNNQFVYTPGANFYGADSFQYIASDGPASSSPANITIVVHSINDAPQIISQLSSVTINEDQAKIINILDAISDVDGDELSIESMSANLGTVEKYNRTEFVYTPPPHFNDEISGGDEIQVTITVTDGSVSQTLYWEVNVEPVEDVPELSYFWRFAGVNSNIFVLYATLQNEDLRASWVPYIFITDENGNDVTPSPNYLDFDPRKLEAYGDRNQFRDYVFASDELAPGTYSIEIVLEDRSDYQFTNHRMPLKRLTIGSSSEPSSNNPPTAVEDHKDDMLPAVAGHDKDLPVLHNDYDDNGDIAITLVSTPVLKKSGSDDTLIQNRVAKPWVTLRKNETGKYITASTDVCFTGLVEANYTIADEEGLTASTSVSFETNVYDENAAPSPETFAVNTLTQDWTEQDNRITFSWAPVFTEGSTSVADKSYKLMLLDAQGTGYVVPSITSDDYNKDTGRFEYQYNLRDPGQYYAYVATCEPGTFNCGCYGDEIAFASYIRWVRDFRALNDVIDSGDTAVLRWRDEQDHSFTLRYKPPGGTWNEIVPDKPGEYSKKLNTQGGHEFQIKVCPPDGNCGGWSATLTVNVRENAMAVEDAPTATDIADAFEDYSNRGNAEMLSAKVGILPGEFRVDESGAATYQVPFTLPQGIAGVTPSLGLSYSSAAGNGPLGMGWSISGLSQITRCRATIEHDGEISAINDRYCLDGQRLIEVSKTIGESGPYANALVEYRTEIDSKTRVISYGPYAYVPTHFRVEREDGSVSYYGAKNILGEDTPLARISYTNSGNAHPLIWKISSISDRVAAYNADTNASGTDNHIRFSYQDFSGLSINDFEVLPEEITYSGNRVRFKWQSSQRPDRHYNSFHNIELEHTKLLDSVLVYNDDDKLVRAYDATYVSSTHSDLINNFSAAAVSVINTLSECGYNDKGIAACKPATTFKWHDTGPRALQTAKTLNNVTTSADFTIESVYPADLNNDGYSDLLIVERNGYDHRVLRKINNHDGFNSAEQLFEFRLLATNEYKAQLLPVDLNADGELEILFYSVNTDTSKINWYTNLWRYAKASTDGSGYNIIDLNIIATGSKKFYQLLPYDINGDSLPDLLYQVGNTIYTKLNNGHGFDSASPVAIAGGYRIDNDDALMSSPIVDINGDGMPDFLLKVQRDRITVVRDGFSLVASPQQGYDFEFRRAGTRLTSLNSNKDDLHFVTMSDVDGDGQADVLYVKEPTDTFVTIDYSSTRFTSRIPLPNGLNAEYLGAIHVFDNNDDSRPDLVFFDQGWYVLYQTVDGRFAKNWSISAIVDYPGFDRKTDRPLIGDWDGDGRPGVGVAFIEERKIIYKADPYTAPKPVHRLRRVTNGFGVKTLVEYKQMTDTSVYTVGNSPTNSHLWGRGSPVLNITSPGFVVSQVTSDSEGYELSNGTSLSRSSGTDAQLSVSYKYHGLRAQAGGRGSLGFARITTTDEQRDIETTTTYRQDFPFVGMPANTTQKRIVADGDERTISWAENQYAVYEIKRKESDSTTYFPYLDISTEKLYGVNTDGSVVQTGTIVTDNTWTAYGGGNHYNLTGTLVSHYSGTLTTSAIKSVNTVNGYGDTNSGTGLNDWILGRLSSTTVTHTRGADTDVRESEFEYYDSGATNGMLKTETIAPNGGEKLKLTTMHCYSDVGNKTKILTFSNHHAITDCDGVPSDTDSVYQVFRKSETVWSADHRHVLQTKNAVHDLQTSSENDYNRFNKPAKVTDVNGVVSHFWYDAFGAVYGSVKSTGERQLTERRFKADAGVDNFAPAVVRYYTFVEKVVSKHGDTHIAPPQYRYFDSLGRVVATAQSGFDPGTFHVTLMSYDLYGREVSRSQPFLFKDGSRDGSLYRHYTELDWLGRPVESTSASGASTTFTYSEGGLTISASVESDKPTQVKKTVKNILGETTQVVDDHGGINATLDYTYFPSGALHTAGISGNIVTTTFDDYGRKTEMNDLNKGEWKYTYNALGELVTQTKKAVSTGVSDVTTTFTRDNAGRTTKRVTGSETTLYQFNTTHPHRLDKECFASGDVCNTSRPVKTVAYDSFGRAHQVTTDLNDSTNVTMVSRTTFDVYGRVFQQFDDYAQRYGIRHHYTNRGYPYMQEEARYSGSCDATTRDHFRGCSNKVYQKITSMNALGKVATWRQNNNIIANTHSYSHETGLLEQTHVTSDNVTIQLNEYKYDDLGNMSSRERSSLHGGQAKLYGMAGFDDGFNIGHQFFGYDKLNRLTKINGEDQVSYDASGNITWKQGVGHYCYTGNRLDKISASHTDCSDAAAFTYDDWGNITSNPTEEGTRIIAYSDFDKAESITKDGKTTTFAYDTGRSRYERITDLTPQGENTATQQRTLYFGNIERIYERDSDSAAWVLTETRRNLPGAIQTIYADTGVESTHFQHKDNLGSVNTVTNENGRIVQKMYFDPWGKKHRLGLHMWTLDAKAMQAPTLAGILDITPRGFTGHEHVDHADIIHMNGRIYDPTLGRFLQADPFIQAPSNSQSYNRYSYGMNNPLSGTDPSGYIFGFLKNTWKKVKQFASIIVAAAISFYCPTCAGWAIGMISGAVGAAANGGNILKGAVIGAFTGGLGGPVNSIGSFISNGIIGGVGSVASGGKFGHGFVSAGLSGLAGGQIGKIGNPVGRIVTRALIGGTISKITGGKFANGAAGAALAQTLAEDWSKVEGFFGESGKSILVADPENHGTEMELYDGKVKVAKWGSKDAKLSFKERGTVRSDLKKIFGTEEGAKMLDALTVDEPLKILINNEGINAGATGNRLMTVDISSKVYFRNMNTGNVVQASTTRLFAHEMGHAVGGYSDLRSVNVLQTDILMKTINGTSRRSYLNVCEVRIACGF